MGHPPVTKIYIEEKLYSVRSLVAVHILNFQRDLVVMRFIRFELITCSPNKVRKYIHVLDAMSHKQSAFSLKYIYIYIYVDKKNQLDITFCILYFSSNSCSTCFGQPCPHHQELTTA